MIDKKCLILGLGLALAACTVSPMTPAPTATPTLAPLVVVVITATASQVPPTATRVPATATTLPTDAPAEADEAARLDAGTEAVAAVESSSTGLVAPPAATGAEAQAVVAAVPPPATAVPVPVVAPPQSSDAAAGEQYCIDLINAQRAIAGLPALVRDETLMGVARGRVADMVARGYTGHYDPVTGMSLSRVMIQAAGFSSSYMGENWYGTVNGPPLTAEVAMNWFMTDAAHYRNILNPNYTVVGVGIAFNGRQWLLVQNFAGN